MSKSRREIPIPALPIIETHFHLDMLKAASREEIVEKAKAHNIEKMITISTNPNNLDEVISIAAAFPNMYCTQGLHPHEGKEWNDEVKAHVIKNLNTKNKKIVAVGEIGLDFYYSKSPRDEQIKAFEEQLQIACDFDLPVVIHTRDADEDTISVLKNFSTTLKRKGVIHSFTSSIDLAKFCLDEGFYIGFNGIITFKNAENVRDALRVTPMERILLETDSPFLTPDPYRGVENAPYYLPFIAERVAAVKETSLEEVLKAAYQNSNNLFCF
ncbi:MAG: TatD family hydrolase [Bdellovibrionales bacterium]|nr:TatD family hydrolase [Bdellovibrionales bacterium]